MKLIKYPVLIIFIIVFLAGYALAGENLTYDAASLRDPFVPLVTEGGLYIGNTQLIESLNDITLEGIVWDPNSEPICIINGMVLRKGEEIGGAQIMEINEDAISVLINGRSYTIPLIE